MDSRAKNKFIDGSLPQPVPMIPISLLGPIELNNMGNHIADQLCCLQD